MDIPLWEVADLDQPSGKGDKKILREVSIFLYFKFSFKSIVCFHFCLILFHTPLFRSRICLVCIMLQFFPREQFRSMFLLFLFFFAFLTIFFFGLFYVFRYKHLTLQNSTSFFLLKELTVYRASLA